MASAQAAVKAFMKSLDTTNLKGSAAVDTAVKASSNFKNAQTAINQMISDCKSYIAADSKNGWKKFLLEKCGINLDNSDTGAITGSDAGGSKVKTAESVVPESGSLKKFTGNSFTVNGLTFTLEKDFKKLSAKEQFIWQALYTWWAKGSLNLVSESYGYSFTNSDATFKKVTVKFVDESSTWLAWYNAEDIGSDGKVDKCSLNINTNYYANIDVTNPNGKSSATSIYLDRTMAHEFTHIAMAAKVNNFFGLPEFIKEGIADLTIGIDDERLSSITYLTKNPSVMSKWLNLNYTGGKSTSDDYSYAAGYMFLRYLGKQNSATTASSTTTASSSTTGKNSTNSNTKTSVSTNSGNTIVSSGSYVTLTGGKGADSISSTGNNNVTISSGDGNDSIYCRAKTASINAGAGNDYVYLYSQSAKTTVKTGTGNDTIMNYAKGVLYQYASGDGSDLISAFGATDTLSISGSSYTSVKSGKNLVVQVGNGKITLGGAASLSKINIVGNSSTATTSVKTSASTTTLTVTDSTKSPVTVGSSVKTIDASKRTSAVKITGNALDNSIYGGSKNDTVYGGSGKDYIVGNAGNDSVCGETGNDSVWGGTGNDSLWGGNDNDYIVGGDGNDYLSGGTGNDTIWGEKGNDSIWSGAGNDTVWGGDDNDYIVGESGNDLLCGNAGNDSLWGQTGNDSIWGGAGNDYIPGGEDNDYLCGDAGNDTIWGGAGNDSIWGGEGNDILIGGDGNDYLCGNAGNDSLWGEKGNDTIWGGAGADKFIYAKGDGNDIIFDFDNNDLLQITGAFSATYNSKTKTISFKVDSTAGAITLANFSATTFNINGTKYHISGTKLVK